ncbi:MAG: Transcriptional regulator MntR [Pelotomaculum sp. PtaU1.Bin065]|nr:MAG: Transcriptional regulator MntR [Pelotomaculum sp. PtaU1.Bin065]
MIKIQQSGEDYLETILLLNIKNGHVRSIDIANELGYSKPSISRAMGILKKAGYIVMEPNGNIVFTEKGKQKAMEIYERHQVITKYLIKALGVDPVAAEKDACRIEHVISQHSFNRIKALINNSDLP